MATNPPITVYLDTSDYSNFADACASVSGDHESLPIFEELLEMKQQGVVEFRYSMFHIIEILQGASGNEKLAINKADIIETLCGSKCMKDHDELLCLEAIRWLSKDGDRTALSKFPVFGYSDNGNWSHRIYKEIFKDIKNFEKAERQGFYDRLKSNFSFSRSERRRARAMWYRKKRTREKPKEFLRNADKEILELFRSQLHGTPEIKDLLVDLSLGNITYKEYIEQLNQISFSPSKFVREKLFEPQSGRDDHFGSLLQGVYAGLMDDIRSFRSLMASTSQNPGQFQYDDIWYRKWFVEDRLMANLDMLRENRIGENRIRGLSTKMSNGDFPSFDMLLASLKEYTRLHGSIGPTMRKIKKSDVGDIFHSVYLPYVDIFRADKFFSEVLKNSSRTYNTVVVKKISELPSAIHSALNINGGNGSAFRNG